MMRLSPRSCLLVGYLINLLVASKLNKRPDACPEDLVCTCEDEYIAGYGTAVEVSCKSMGLKTVPDLSSLAGVSLHKLDLSDNQISALREDDFSGIQMKSVYPYTTAEVILDRNPIQEIAVHAFRGMTSEGLGIHISNCGLKTIPFTALRNIPHLINLYFDNNKLDSIPDYSFVGFAYLEYLDISSNPLETLNPDIFGGLEDSLQGIHLKNVGLESFPAHALKRLRKLETVNLNNNAITTLPDYVFDGFETTNKFFILYLKNNGIRRVSPLAFVRSGTVLEVKGLHMEENLVQDVAFLYNPCDLIFSSEADIWLENNPLNCDCGLYSATFTGFYRLEGTCAGPGDYKGVRVDVVRARQGAGRPSFEGGFGTLARSDCGPRNITQWDMTCARMDKRVSFANKAGFVHDTLMAVTVCIALSRLIA